MNMIRIFILACMTAICSFANAQTYGCTDPAANNFNPQADVDNGYCCYGNYLTIEASDNIGNVEFFSLQSFYGMYWPIYTDNCFPDGCVTVHAHRVTDNQPAWVSVFNNGLLVATITDFEEFGGYYGLGLGVANFDLGVVSAGCTSSFACNFDPNATCDDGSCDLSCAGCTDPSAANFNPSATIEDGSCCSQTNFLTFTSTGPLSANSEVYFYGFGAALSFAPGESSGCISDGCWNVYLFDSMVDSAATCTLSNAAGDVLASGLASDFFAGISININAVEGCPDPSACNYNPLSTCYLYNTCNYDCFGCTNPNAGNYDPTATIDDGSCCIQYFTIVADGEMYWSIWSPINYSGGYGVYPYQDGLCLLDGCFNISTSTQYDPELGNTPNVNWQLLDSDGNVVVSGSTLSGIVSTFNSGNVIEGCMNGAACNYNPNANCGGYELCTFDCYGCTDINASNFNPDALIDNSTCCYNEWYTIQATVPGTWSVNASLGGYYATGNYPEQNGFCSFEGCGNFSFYPIDFMIWDYEVTIYNSDGEVVATMINSQTEFQDYIYLENNAISGCGDSYACNYDPNINCFDYALCDYSCYGCTDETAPNYNPTASIDNGSCCYGSWYTLEMTSPAYWSAYDTQTGAYYYGNYPEQPGFCMGTDCFQFQAWSIFGEEISYTVSNSEGVIVVNEAFGFEGEMLLVNPLNATVGCGDYSACNYDPNADCNDYFLCDYSCYGCTNPEAPNYDPQATLDNGTCCLNNWLTVSVDQPCYWYVIDGFNSYSAGFYPDQTGFCTTSSCLGFYAYSLDGQEINFTVTDEAGNVVLSGNNTLWGFEAYDISLSEEIAGCTNETACNYNEFATCDNGTCDYYCAGCTDPLALNFNPFVEMEDGSCIYNMELPNMGMNIVTDEENEQYYVLLSMMNEGNGAPYVLSNDYNSEFTMINESGQYLSGPYPCDMEVEMNLVSMSAGLSTYYSASMEGACAQTISTNEVKDLNTINVFPNPASNRLQITGLPQGPNQIDLYDVSGRKVWSEKVVSNGSVVVIDIEPTAGVYQLVSIAEGKRQSVRVIFE